VSARQSHNRLPVPSSYHCLSWRKPDTRTSCCLIAVGLGARGCLVAAAQCSLCGEHSAHFQHEVGRAALRGESCSPWLHLHSSGQWCSQHQLELAPLGTALPVTLLFARSTPATCLQSAFPCSCALRHSGTAMAALQELLVLWPLSLSGTRSPVCTCLPASACLVRPTRPHTVPLTVAAHVCIATALRTARPAGQAHPAPPPLGGGPTLCVNLLHWVPSSIAWLRRARAGRLGWYTAGARLTCGTWPQSWRQRWPACRARCSPARPSCWSTSWPPCSRRATAAPRPGAPARRSAFQPPPRHALWH